MEPAEAEPQCQKTAPVVAQTDHGPIHRGWRFWLAFGAVAFANLATSFEATTLSVTLPIISADLGGTAVDAFWAGTSYPLAATVFMLNWVAFSDKFGRRPMMLLALATFAVGSVVCAVARNYTVMLVGRTVQGIGGGGGMGLTTVIVTDMVPLRDRAKFYSVISAVWAVGSTTGPIIGGALAQEGSWRWIFWINLPIVIVSWVGIAIFLRLDREQRSFSEKLSQIDHVGSILFVASATAILVPVTWGGVQYDWGSWHTLVPLILGFGGLAVFCVYEVRVAPNPLIPMFILLNPSTSIVYFSSFFFGLILWSLVYYIPEYYLSVQAYSPIISGVAVLPMSATVVPCAVIVGVAVGMAGRYRWALWSGWLATTFGCGILIKLGVNTSVPAWIFLTAVAGIGLGLLLPSISLAIQSSVPQKDVAMAATLVIFCRYFGATLGVGIGGNIFQNRLSANLQDVSNLSTGPLQHTRDAVALMAALRNMPQDSPLAIALRKAFARSFQIVWAVMCGLAGINTLATFFVKEYDMNQKHITEQGFLPERRKSELELSTSEVATSGSEKQDQTNIMIRID